MIIKGFAVIVWEFIKTIMSMSGAPVALPSWFGSFSNMIATALFFFPADVWAALISSIVFWTGVNMVYALIEWILKKIPFVGME